MSSYTPSSGDPALRISLCCVAGQLCRAFSHALGLCWNRTSPPLLWGAWGTWAKGLIVLLSSGRRPYLVALELSHLQDLRVSVAPCPHGNHITYITRLLHTLVLGLLARTIAPAMVAAGIFITPDFQQHGLIPQPWGVKV